MKKSSLESILNDYSESTDYPFHMPGHKRRAAFVGAETDITEIEGFDNLANPTGVLKRLEDDFANIYGADKSFCLVGGSTVGLLAAVYSIADKGCKLLMARNCHKSVYNAARIAGLEPVYLYPQMDENAICRAITVKDFEQQSDLATDEIAGVVITSPTYEGVVSDVEAIGDYLHKMGIPLIVDAAHGAYLPFFQKNIKQSLGDITVMSLHKTMPALNSSALLHIKSRLIDGDNMREIINMFQTSSPSYPVLASMDWCRSFCEREAEDAFSRYEDRLAKFYERCGRLNSFGLFNADNKDRGKLVIICNKEGFDGFDLEKRLREKYRIVMEMSSRYYVIGMTSAFDTDDGFERLAKALIETDAEINDYPNRVKSEITYPRANLSDTYPRAEKDIYAYPPGAPIVAKSEAISPEAVDFLDRICNIKI